MTDPKNDLKKAFETTLMEAVELVLIQATLNGQQNSFEKEFGVFLVPHDVLGNDKNQYKAGIITVSEFVKLVKNSRR